MGRHAGFRDFSDTRRETDRPFGGRLITDRLFFFGGFEWFDRAASNVVNSSFPELNGDVPATTDQKLYFVKLEHHSSASSTYTARYNRETRQSTGLGVGGIVTEEQGLSEGYTANDVVGTWSRIVSASSFNELRAAFNDTTSDSRCNFAERNPRAPGSGEGIRRGLGCPQASGASAVSFS